MLLTDKMENQNRPVETGSDTESITFQDNQLLSEIGEIGRLSDEINQSLTEIQWRRQLDASAAIAEQTENGNNVVGDRNNPPTHPYHEMPATTVTMASPREIIYPGIGSVWGNSAHPPRTTTTCVTETVYSAGTCGHNNLVIHSNPLNTLARSTPVYFSTPGTTGPQTNQNPDVIVVSDPGTTRRNYAVTTASLLAQTSARTP